MVKEIKYFIFVLLILSFIFLTGRYYFSDTNKKKKKKFNFWKLLENNE